MTVRSDFPAGAPTRVAGKRTVIREHFHRPAGFAGFRLAALGCLIALLAMACGDDAETAPEAATVETSAATQVEPDDGGGQSSSASSDDGSDQSSSSSSDSDEAQSSSSSEDDGGQSSSSSSDYDGASGSSGDDDAVSYENPGAEGVHFDAAQNLALAGAEPLQVVEWTTGPYVGMGELVAAGEMPPGVFLFDPMNGEGSAFSVFYKGHEEAMVELLPDLGPMQVWDTYLTVAPTEWEIEGSKFSLRAYSPLFMDVGPSDLEIRVYGYDESGAAALLAVEDIGLQ